MTRVSDRLDCLVEMLEEMRVEGRAIPFFDADRREPWFDAMEQLVNALKGRDQQCAWVALIATDLCERTPGLSLRSAALFVQARLCITC